MSTSNHITRRAPVIMVVWGVLLFLTFISLGFGEWFRSVSWLPLFVAVVIWIKGTLVARYFIGTHQAHPFIVWLLRIFIAFIALALLLTAFFPHYVARLTTVV